MDMLISTWLNDCGRAMILCLILFAALSANLLIKHLRKPDWTAMTKKARRKAKKNRLKSAPRLWLIAVATLLLAYTVFASLPYFRDMADPQLQTTSAEIVSLHSKPVNRRIRYYVCTVQTESDKIELKLSREQYENLSLAPGEIRAFSYYPHSRVLIDISVSD